MTIRRHIRRQAVVVAICLALGAALSVIVGWGCKLHHYVGFYQSPSIRTGNYHYAEHGDGFHVMTWRGGGIAIYRLRAVFTDVDASSMPAHERAIFQQTLRGVYAGADERPPTWVRRPTDEPPIRTSTACGWPFPCLVGFVDEPTTGGRVRSWVWTPTDWRPAARGAMVANKLALPLRPLWPQFLVNTALYAGAMWVLAVIPLAMRSLIRRRTGQCPDCAYDMRGLERCPECGYSRIGSKAISASR